MSESIRLRSEPRTVVRRREAVLGEVLAGNGNVRTLSDRLGVSEATIRRDLVALSKTGRTTRTYGGAVASPRQLELSLTEKESLHTDRKQAIARRASEMVGDGETVILDAGTTVGRLAGALVDRAGLTAVTNGLSSMLALAGADGVDLVSVGGSLRHISQAFVGPLAELVLERISADATFLGADGLSANGLCCPTANHASLKTLMATRATHVFVLCDSSKLGHAPHHHWVPWESGWTVITDSEATAPDVAELEAHGLRVQVVPVPDAT